MTIKTYEAQTDTMRVALARREAADIIAGIDRKLHARKRVLMAAGANTEAAFKKATAADEEFKALVLARVAAEIWRDRCVEDGFVPMIGEPGEAIRWRLPGRDA